MRSSSIVNRSLLATSSLLCLTALSSSGQTWNGNNDHKILVYDLQTYEQIQDYAQGGVLKDWKHNVTPRNTNMLPKTFYDTMGSGGTSDAANGYSKYYSNGNVTVARMTSPGGTLGTGITTGELTLLFGHQYVIVNDNWLGVDPTHNNAPLGYDIWLPYNIAYNFLTDMVNGTYWGTLTLYDTPQYDGGSTIFDFGTTREPFFYHYRGTAIGQRGIRNAKAYAIPSYAMYDAVHPLTSILINQDFTTGTWTVRDTINGAGIDRTGQLGPNSSTGSRLKFLVADGCQLLPTARYRNRFPSGGIEPSEQAHNMWKASWRGMHVVVGHYYSSGLDRLPNLQQFAQYLRAGYGVAEAWWMAHAGVPTQANDPALGMASALSPRAYVPTSCRGTNDAFYCDHWTTPMQADPTTTDEAGPWRGWFVTR
jgi:hypothetical protein